MKPLILHFLVCIICVAAVPVMAAGDYMGEGIQLGGSGTMITRVTTVPATTAAAVPAAAATGSLSVTTTPAGASIFVDGVQRGISPVTISGLAPGTHTLLVTMNGYTDLTTTVTILAGQTLASTPALSPVATPLPAIPAATKTPGFEAVPGIAALGLVLVAKKRSW